MIYLTASSEPTRRYFTISALLAKSGRQHTHVQASRIAILDTGGEVQQPRFEGAINEARMVSKTYGTRLLEDQDSDHYGIRLGRLALVVAPPAKLSDCRSAERR